ncbi:MAG: excisionase family DNA-binding protein [Myxococcota bacterium]
MRAGSEGQEVTLTVPREAFELFTQVLAEMANGNAVTLMPVNAELTTQAAAGLLNVSRPFLIQLLEDQEIPYRMVGTHRRILAEDVIRYRESSKVRSKKALKELAELAQEHDLGY